jgi:hypothetical protein
VMDNRGAFACGAGAYPTAGRFDCRPYPTAGAFDSSRSPQVHGLGIKIGRCLMFLCRLWTVCCDHRDFMANGDC